MIGRVLAPYAVHFERIRSAELVSVGTVISPLSMLAIWTLAKRRRVW
jgi:hypothetical protein